MTKFGDAVWWASTTIISAGIPARLGTIAATSASWLVEKVARTRRSPRADGGRESRMLS
jgi:hypothetical protein